MKEKKKKLIKGLVGVCFSLAIVFSLMSFDSVAVYAAPSVHDVSFDTNQNKGSYSSEDITINCTHAGDSDGMFIGNSNSFTVTAATGFFIDKVELTVGYYAQNSNALSTSVGQLSGNTSGSSFITNSNINASSVTYTAKIGGTLYNLQICKVKVYYENKPNVSDCTISQIEDQVYTGSQITPEPTVKDGDKVLQKDTDYTLEYGSNVNVNDGGTVTIKGKDNYTGSKTINFKILPIKITDGGNQTIDVSSGKDAVFTSNAELADFIKLAIDGNVVGSGNYNVASGSTIVTIKNEYLKTLTNGNHQLSIVSDTGSADTTFTITGIEVKVFPETGDTSNIALLLIANVVACAGFLVAVCKKKACR